jgi:hypothetical protein
VIAALPMAETNAMSPAPSVTVGPSPLKIFGGIALLSIAGTGGVAIFVVFFGFLAHPWLLANAWTIIAGAAALLAGWCALAVFGALIWRRPRVEIDSDGFVTQGTFGRRPRRWNDIEGGFAVIRVGLQSVVAYRLTDAFKECVRIQPISSLAEYDEAISFCGELAIGAEELADLLNRWKHDVPSATPSA